MRSFVGWVTLVLAATAAAFACSPSDPIAPATDAAVEKTPIGNGDAAPPLEGPAKLSETGLYADFAARTLAPGVIEVAPKWPLWSDGSTKRRFLLLPEGAKIDTTDMDDWIFPVGTKAWKEFAKDGVLVETRFLWKKTATQWFEVAYVWQPDESDALAAPNGVLGARGTTHDVPEQVKCRACHDNVADTIIGVSAIQGSDGGAGFLTKLGKAGLLTVVPPAEFTIPGSPQVQAALGYLHGNCGGCHNDGAKFQGQTALRLRVLTTETTVEKTGVYRTAFGLKMVHPIPPDITDALIAGDPDRSGIWIRMEHRDGHAMPPIGTKVPDPDGLSTVRTWILGLGSDASIDDAGKD
jgi:hypothetical protein